jgi:uncharacterized protein (TIGR00251 family)
MAQWARSDGDGTLIEVWVAPGASRTAVAGEHGGALRVRVAAPPERGRANRALLELLGEALGADVELVAGESTRRKRVRAAAITAEQVVARLRPSLHHDC